MTNELPIIQKTFDMLLWLIPKIDQFSKRQKFLLGERIERTALDYPPGGVVPRIFRSRGMPAGQGD